VNAPLRLLAAAAALAGAAGELRSAETRPNILWIVADDASPDLGCYGAKSARTPHLNGLAAQGVRFTNAFVPYSVCSPSRAAYLTGLYPQQNGQLGLATHRFAMYRGDTPNVVTLLKGAGYHAGLIGKLHVNPESAFPLDFHAIKGANFQRTEPVEAYAEAAAKFWREAGTKPWFLSVNYPDPHLPFLRQVKGQPARPLTAAEVEIQPWIGADSPRLREMAADYHSCMARLDEGVGRLLAALERTGTAANTMVVFFSDHGSQFPRAKGSVYDCALRIPLIVRWPAKAARGLVRDALVSTVDLLPTTLKAVGVPSPTLPGFDLHPLLASGNATSGRQYVHAITTGSNPRACFVQESVQDSRWKLIWTPPQPTPNGLAISYWSENDKPPYTASGLIASEFASLSPSMKAVYARWKAPPLHELYDLKSDPHELTNLAEDPKHAATKARLVAALQAWQAQTIDPFQDQRNVDAYVEEQLAARDEGAYDAAQRSAYQQQQDFRWKHIAAFRDWRDRQRR
jgi:N-sulfoglucosamine sulfohydrolase